MAILALLARAGERGISREKLLALLWPDADEERGPRALAQALYALRRDLGAEEAVVGSKDLRLDPGLASSDASEFASALARGDDERAVGLYHGPFLDGFPLPGADEFSRWAERERSAIAVDYSRALESLARSARASGDTRASVTWWRKLAATEPLNARVAVGLMDALVGAGDRAGAIQHARVYELLVEQELDLPPDKEVLTLAERLRQGAIEQQPAPTSPPKQSAVAPVAATATQQSVPAATTPAEPVAPIPAPTLEVVVPVQMPVLQEAPTTAPASSAVPTRRRRAIAGVWMLAAAAVVVIAGRSWRARSADVAPGAAVVAIGNIAAYGSDSTPATLTAPITDLLTTSLARVHSIRVVSHGRMLELLHAAGRG